VRKLVGYLRYDTPALVTALNDLYRHEVRLFQNLFLPSVKLVGKVRVGARVRRRYDVPRTPLERVQACPEADPVAVARLVALRDHLDPFAVAATLDRKLERLLALAGTVPAAAPAPARPGVVLRPSRRRTRPPRPTHLREFAFGNRHRRLPPARARVTS
jgi:hypothetical protein